MMEHICGQCGKEFDSEPAYLKHSCQTSGVAPHETEFSPPKPKVASTLEKTIFTAVQLARAKKQYNA
jgi:hypothetical protein